MHGRPIVAAVVGYLTVSTFGLSFVELIDLMSSTVVHRVGNGGRSWWQGHHSARSADVSWLVKDLRPLLVERTAEGALSFAHEALTDAALERYLGGGAAGLLRLQLVDYCTGRKPTDGALSLPQPLVFSAGRYVQYNTWLVAELPAQIGAMSPSAIHGDPNAAALLHRALTAVVLTLEFVEAVAAVGRVYDLVQDLLHIQELLQELLALAIRDRRPLPSAQPKAAAPSTAGQPRSAAGNRSPPAAPLQKEKPGSSVAALHDLLQRTRNQIRFLQMSGQPTRLHASPWETVQLAINCADKLDLSVVEHAGRTHSGHSTVATADHEGWPSGTAMATAREAMLDAADFAPQLTLVLRSACKRDEVSSLHHTLLGHRDEVKTVCYSPDGKIIASAGLDGAVMLWMAATGRRLITLLGHGRAPVVAAVFLSPWLLSTAGDDGWIVIWDTRTKKVVGELLSNAHEVVCMAAQPSPLASANVTCWLAHGGPDGCIGLHMVNTGLPKRDSAPDIVLQMDGANSGATAESEWSPVDPDRDDSAAVLSLAFADSGEALAGSDRLGTVRLWKINRRSSATSPPVLLGCLKAHDRPVNCIRFGCGDSTGRLATAGDDASIKIWDLVRILKSWPQKHAC